MLRLVKNTIKQIVFIPLFVFSSAVISQTFEWSDAIQLIDEDGVAVIPDNYTSIGSGAFENTNLVKVIMPNSITSIGERAFSNTYNLEEAVLPDGLTVIPERAFQNSNISNIDLTGINDIGYFAFQGSNLKSVLLADGVTIRYQAFANSKLEHLIIPTNAIVESQAFSGIKELYSVKIMDNVTTQDSPSFNNNLTRQGVIFYGSHESLKTLIYVDTPYCQRQYDQYNQWVYSSSPFNRYIWRGLCFFEFLEELEILIVENGSFYSNTNHSDATTIIKGNVSGSGVTGDVLVLDSISLGGPISNSVHSICNDIDTDFDGHQDCYDQFPNDPNRWFDYDDESNNTSQPISNDSDGDGILDIFDTSYAQNYCYDEQSAVGFTLDTDQDGIINRDDCDDDNDGLFDIYEPFFGTNPLLADSDFDGTLDGLDAFPMDNTESLDTDTDGIGNNTDTDDDNDGYTDFLDAFPTDATEWADSDLDGIGNNLDSDDDNDGVADTEDAFPHTASESLDSDNDGVGDNADAFPNDATEVADTDLDGIGNNADPDDDNDGVADADDGDPLNADIGIQPSQLISVAGNPVGVNGHSTKISLSYDTSDGNNQLPGIGFRLHYSSEMLSFAGTENSIANDIIVDGDGPYQDDSDYDNDSNTDKYIIFGWAALNGDWPNSSLPASLVDVVFNVSWEAFDQASITTPINFSKVSTTEGYNFEATNYTLNVLPATWDFDGNGQADALTDGLILLRHAFGVRGASLTDSVMATDSTMTSEEVQVAVEKALVIADVDGDGNVDALTDGLIVLRYMFGLTGDTLMDGVVSANATRASAEAVQQHIELYMPNNLLPPVQSEQSFIVGDWKLAGVPDKREYEEGALQDWNFYGSAYSQAEFDNCVADDIYRFGENGTFEYLINGSTYMDEELNPLYDWNDYTSSSCVSPLAPWNEDQIYTYSIDQNNSLLTVNGYGAYIALAHVANGTDDLENAADAPESISYDFTKLSDTELLLEIDAYDDFYRFTLEKNDSVLMTIASNNIPIDGSGSVTGNLCDQVVAADFISFNADCTVGTITGTIDTDYTLLEEVQYILSGVVKVGEGNVEITSAAQMQAIQDAGATLTVEPGSDVKATADGVLLVTRGSKLIADAYPAKPITFSSLDDNYDGMGEWGGVVIQGFAPQYGQGGTGACFYDGEDWCNVLGEGGDFVQEYGGNLPADDSGIIRYVRIAEGGLIAGPNNEINGLTLQGVGYSTLIEYIQLHNNQDDGIEWFGGTANVKHAVLTNNDDDDIDFDEGYQGNIQYALIIKNQTPGATPVGSNDPRGIELNSSNADYTPETAGVIANVTIVGGDAANSAGEFGMRLRGSVTAAIHNSAVTGYDVTCARIDYSDHDYDDSTEKLPTFVSMNNFLCDTAGDAFNKEDPIDTETVILEPITFDSNYGITNASAIVEATSIDAYDNGSSFVFDQTSFIGAVDPSAATTWYEEWIIPGSVN